MIAVHLSYLPVRLIQDVNAIAIVNPKSGGGRSTQTWGRARAQLPTGVETRETEAEGHGIELTAEALKRGVKTIIAVGGDGTINEVVNGFFEGGQPIASDAALGIIPCGTGSDFVRTLKVPTDPTQAAEIILRGVTKTI